MQMFLVSLKLGMRTFHELSFNVIVTSPYPFLLVSMDLRFKDMSILATFVHFSGQKQKEVDKTDAGRRIYVSWNK